jgi:hypothetical protein
MKRAYYSASVRDGLRSIAARTICTTADELEAVAYIRLREENHGARMASHAHGRAEADRAPVSRVGRSCGPGTPGSQDSRQETNQ